MAGAHFLEFGRLCDDDGLLSLESVFDEVCDIVDQKRVVFVKIYRMASHNTDSIPCSKANANWGSSRCGTEAETLSLRLSEMILFLDLFGFRSGFAFGRGRMQAIFLEHLIEISSVTAGKLRSA